MLKFLERRRERKALEEQRHKLTIRQAQLECQLIEASTRMAMQHSDPLWGDKEFRRGFKSMMQSEPDFPGRNKLMESLDYFDTLVDPYDAVRGDNGELWDQIASAMYGASEPFLGLLGFRNELELRMARNLSRLLCKENPWAICGIENRINYSVGTGHTYQVIAKKGQNIDPTIIAAVQKTLDAWTERNKWAAMQEDNLWRCDMDGECILRFFETNEGLEVRYVEPWQLTTPAAYMDPSHAWGVEVDIEDSQKIIAYWIDSKAVSPENVQHRKFNVRRNVRRGIPTFYPCRFHLRRAENLLKNMGLVAELQASIAIIRKWPSGSTGASMGAFQASASQASFTNSTTGERRNFEKFRPGTILDVKAGYDYDYPGAGIDASNYAECLQCELRSVSARLNMPEWMLTADASNANYASTMVSEGSSVKMFERLSAAIERDDLEIIWKALRVAARKMNSVFPVEILDQLDITVGVPKIIARDRLQDVQADQIEMAMGILSPQTACSDNDRDYQQEMANMEDHCDRFGGRPATLAGLVPIEPTGQPGDDLPPSPVQAGGNGVATASDDRPLSPNGKPTDPGYTGGLSIPKDLVQGQNPPIDTGPRARKGLPLERTDDLAFFALNAQGSEPGDAVGNIHEGGPGSGPHPSERAMERTRKATNSTLRAREASKKLPASKADLHSDTAAERAGDASNHAINGRHAEAAKSHVQAAAEHTSAMDRHSEAAEHARDIGDKEGAAKHEAAAKLHERAANAHITASNGHSLVHNMAALAGHESEPVFAARPKK